LSKREKARSNGIELATNFVTPLDEFHAEHVDVVLDSSNIGVEEV
jgi:hypothetical protein